MSHATDVIGYAADADVWCVDCAEKRYGRLMGRTDDEGNDVHPIFASDDADGPQVCAGCGEELE